MLSRFVKLGAVSLSRALFCCCGSSYNLVASRNDILRDSKDFVCGAGSSSLMMSTVGVELINFINPDLTWKTVSKGSRSSTRRTRKSVSRKLAVKMEQGSENGATTVEATVSDSEKAGVAILGRRFSEKVGHVPIKKRRLEYLSSSPPPPQTPSPHPELSEQHAHDQSTSDESLLNTRWGRGPSKVGDVMESNIEVDDRSFLYMNGKKCGIAEDFSGIEILAAAACSDSIAHDDLPSKSNSLMSESNQEHADSMISERLAETASASMQFDNPSAKALTTESKVDLSSPGCINIVPNESLCDKKSAEPFVSVPEDRSLWDLNLTIDAWERPCACNDVASEKESDEGVPDESEKFHVAEPNDVKVNSTLMMASSTNDAKCVHSRIFYAGTDCLSGEEKKVKEFSVLKRESDGEPVSVASTNQDKQPVMSEVLTGVSKVEHCIDQSLLPQSDAPIVEEARKLSITLNAEVDVEDVDCIVGEIKDAKPVEGASFDANYKDCGDAVPSDIKLSAYENQLQTDLTAAAVRPENEVEGVDVSQASRKSDFAIISSHDAHSSAKYVGQDASVLKPHENIIDSSVLCVLSTHEESSAKLDAASMGVSQAAAICQDSVIDAGVEESLELQAGYDSQFEDGELREPDVQLWDEIEQVDYDTEGEEERHSCKQSDTGEKKLDMGSVSNAADRLLRNGNIEGASMDLKFDNGNISDGSRIKVETVHSFDELHVGTSDLRLDGTKASPEGVRRSSGFDDSCSIAERDGYPDRYVERERAGPRLCGRSPGNGRTFNRSNAHWNSRQQHSPVRRDLYNPVRMRPRGAVESHEYVMATDGDISDVAGVSRTGQRFSRQFLPTSNGAYRSHMRRRSPLAREESYGMQSRMTSLRESNPDGRSMFRRYAQNGGRGGRGDYVKHIADSTEYFGRMTHRLGRRERSGSPNGGRLHYAAYRGSRSRSRSRSPMPWLHQRGRNEGSSHRSRSPNFKSGAGRMDRLRMMFPKRFASDYKEGFMPAARNHVSPPRDNRLFDERNTDFDHLRSRKSPVRMFRQTQRFDSMRSSRSPSPTPWYQRDRNEGSSHRSRSPNFKSDGARMGRGRMMFQKRFTSNYKDGFVPGPRNHVSSPHANRSFEDRNIDFDNFRSRTSPVRMFSQNHRFDSGRSGRRLDADDHLRPMIRPRRFTDTSASGKGGKYEDGEDDKSRGSRQCETSDGTVRQCQQFDKAEEAASVVAAVVVEEC